ncbi:MAG: hypothetical protein MUQ27_06210 [Acidimicrobiia bacterium]|nr:hypothetical protein [Acidimicrobiia bacterium]
MRIELSDVISQPISEVSSFYADDHLVNHPRWDPAMQLSLATHGAQPPQPSPNHPQKQQESAICADMGGRSASQLGMIGRLVPYWRDD